MEILLHAQPYDISANGFYFKNVDEYHKKAKSLKNDYGDLVEEFEIQFIDGEKLDCELAEAIGLNQANSERFFTIIDEWKDYQKINFIIAVGECNYDFDLNSDDPDQLDVDIYEEDNLKELAIRFVDEGLFGDIPENIQCYLDYDVIARDLGMDYSEAVIAGERLIYRCA